MSTILFNPSNEQLKDIVLQNPEFHQKITEEITTKLQEVAKKHVMDKISSRTKTAYDNLYAKVSRDYFTNSTSSQFTPELEKKLTQKIIDNYSIEIEKEFDEYIQTKEFKDLLIKNIQNKILNAVLTSLDNEIKQEAQKVLL